MKKSILLPIFFTAIVISSCGTNDSSSSSANSVFPRFSADAIKNAVKANPAAANTMQSQLAVLKEVNNSLNSLASSPADNNCEAAEPKNSEMGSTIASISDAVACEINTMFDEQDKFFAEYGIVPTIGDATAKLGDNASYSYKIDSSNSTFEVLPEGTSNTTNFSKIKIVWNKANKQVVLAVRSPEGVNKEKSLTLINAYQDASGGINFTFDNADYNLNKSQLGIETGDATATYNKYETFYVAYDTVSKTFAIVDYSIVVDSTANLSAFTPKANIAKPAIGMFVLGNVNDKIVYISQKITFSKDSTSSVDSTPNAAIYCGSDFNNGPADAASVDCKAGKTAGELLGNGIKNIYFSINNSVRSDDSLISFQSSMSTRDFITNINNNIYGLGDNMNSLYNQMLGQ